MEQQEILKLMEKPNPLQGGETLKGRNEQTADIYKLLLQKGFITPEQIRYAARVHSKLTGGQTLIQVLQELKYIAAEQLEELLAANRLNLKIGTLLVELGHITRNELETAISLQKESSSRKTIGEILIEEGFVEERKLLEVLSYQLGLPYYQLELAKIDPNLLRRAPAKWFSQHNFLPVSINNGRIIVAFPDPLNRDSVEAAEKTFGKIDPAICSKSDFREIISILERDAAASRSHEPDEKSIVSIVNSLIDEAVRSKTSDIHIEPMRDKVRVRYRIDGVLVQIRDLPVEIGPPLASRLKIMSKADIAERRRHQGGRILFENPRTGTTLDLRISFFVTVWGETIVMRLLNTKAQVHDLTGIGMFPKMLDRFRLDALDMPSGVIMVTGPTGSGKTTTLYSAINYLESVNTCIVTVEDPVEFLLDGIAQCSIDPKINLTFEESLRHVVRQDPDIIVIGEVRDQFSAETCIQASLTGHKVLTTFHTEDSIGCLIRLLNMNIEPFLISSTVVGVIAQRLLRKICPKCAESYTPQPSDLYRLGYSAADIKGSHFKIGRGCTECRFTGYRGRLGVFELLILNEPVKDAVLTKKTSYEIRKISMETSGLVTLIEDGIMKAVTGTTTLQEVFRSLPRVIKPRPIPELRRLLGTDQ
ncbi:MAG: ATPase, T2SS/T4P/T4SS family [Syntrophobacteraceae bacterium]